MIKWGGDSSNDTPQSADEAGSFKTFLSEPAALADGPALNLVFRSLTLLQITGSALKTVILQDKPASRRLEAGTELLRRCQRRKHPSEMLSVRLLGYRDRGVPSSCGGSGAEERLMGTHRKTRRLQEVLHVII